MIGWIWTSKDTRYLKGFNRERLSFPSGHKQTSVSFRPKVRTNRILYIVLSFHHMITWPHTFQTKCAGLSLQPVAALQGIAKVFPRVTTRIRTRSPKHRAPSLYHLAIPVCWPDTLCVKILDSYYFQWLYCPHKSHRLSDSFGFTQSPSADSKETISFLLARDRTHIFTTKRGKNLA